MPLVDVGDDAVSGTWVASKVTTVAGPERSQADGSSPNSAIAANTPSPVLSTKGNSSSLARGVGDPLHHGARGERARVP
ncbi:hypothetical protein OHA72_35115 [Dactylosporangium sp. NBC_01737]|uniref:hypothetical protein n=1 Tax=Dactylosporangium sp. NBC_01737 TaxID=2975959 RepID=UPI002E13A46C|nr:hypothetical protein OHA72_35115 [Dactylosporangium sp. NBC_01737]